MYQSFKYRSIALVFAVIFIVFNVGIPVVISSCPMMKESVRPSCCPQQSDFRNPVVNKYNNYSCCKTIISPGKNRIEYIPTNVDINLKIVKYTISSSLEFSTNNYTDVAKRSLSNTHSPPSFRDIPIITSSLLI